MSGPTYTRRQAYAQFLLFGDPIALRMHSITEAEKLVVTVADLAELGRWKRAFLGDNVRSEHVYDDAEADTLLAYAEGTWAGWRLQFLVYAPVRQDDDVDELAAGGTREQLQQLVDGRTENVVDQVLAEPLAQLDAMKTALEQQFVDEHLDGVIDCKGCDCWTAAPRDEDDPGAYPGPDPDCECLCHEDGVPL